MNGKPLKDILYVEDDPDVQLVARIALEKVGKFNLFVASSGQEAIDALSKFRPDLVLLDMMMPDMDGVTTMKHIHAKPEWKNLPIIFLTAKVRPEEVARYKAMGALWVIMKPFDPMTLSAQVRSIWEQSEFDTKVAR